MQLCKVKTLRQKDWSKGTMIYKLISQGKIKAYKNQDGELMYDRDEYSAYRKITRRGRPLKQKDITNIDNRRKKKDATINN